MAIVSATVFKARCLELMDRVAERREAYVITKRGRPVARLVPADVPKPEVVFGCMTGQMDLVGDVEKPLWSDEEWRRFERERVEKARVWEEEWGRTSTRRRRRGKRTASPS